ncbi:MAG: AMP-binding protein, partial [bacterium]|nr:AMP-binding protein [bacterium]
TLEAFENQEYQFEDLVNHVAVNRDTSRNPLFDVMFSLQKREAGTTKNSTLEMTFDRHHILTSRFDITFDVWEEDEELRLEVEYVTKLFKKETIRRYTDYFREITRQVLADPEKQIKEMEIISEEEKKKIQIRFNNTAAQYPENKPIHRLFEEQAQRIPEKPAVTAPAATPEGNTTHHTLTYRQLNEKATQLAGILIKKGVTPGTIVGIIVERSLEMMVGIMGILKTGAAYMPITPDYPTHRIQYMLKDSCAKLLISDGSAPSPLTDNNKKMEILNIKNTQELREFNELNELHELDELNELRELNTPESGIRNPVSYII